MSKLPNYLQINWPSHKDVFFRTTEIIFSNIAYIFLFEFWFLKTYVATCWAEARKEIDSEIFIQYTVIEDNAL